MNVEQLWGILKDLPLDMPVVLAKDAEGNGFSLLAEVYQAFYDTDSDELRSYGPVPSSAKSDVVLALILGPS